ncbi:alcohol dehydrogenase [Pleurostoma richardsiae]|uniref:Alcohol dehydrogenase n=1 Tax=Pleurostoma richardsiae TaxID=41990 RepID=A0AA38RJJ9_9PEZI|nr:alcohol dehydrogenase [Pleurostoma richardsiae]
MSLPFKALFVDQHAHFEVIERDELPNPSGDELLIKTLFSGVNPADIKHATHLGITHTVLGYDFCGEVIETPGQSSTFRKGDVVAGYTPSGIGRPAKYGTHQAYLACPETMLFKVPTQLPQPDAACLTVVAMTAADALYNRLRLPLPSERQASQQKGALLLWGATAAVGYCALQFAVASGIYPIIVTGTPDQFPVLQQRGATRCFDYSAEDVSAQISQALEELGLDSFTWAFDAAGVPVSGDQMLRCVSDETQLISTLLRENKRFVMPLATPNLDFTIQPPGAGAPISLPARPDNYKRAWEALSWAIDQYGTSFRLMRVRVMDDSAENILKEIQRVTAQGGGFSKLAIRQPMK